jgi:hypothetical protein
MGEGAAATLAEKFAKTSLSIGIDIVDVANSIGAFPRIIR